MKKAKRKNERNNKQKDRKRKEPWMPGCAH